MFRQLMGAEFDRLPAEIRRVHTLPDSRSFNGECEIERGASLLSRLLGWAARLPPAGKMPVSIAIQTRPGRETWARRFGRHPLRSTLRVRDGLLVESMGLTRLTFRVVSDGASIRWLPVAVHALGLRIPLSWFKLDVSESVADGRYRFNVRVGLHGGLLVHYRGWLA